MTTSTNLHALKRAELFVYDNDYTLYNPHRNKHLDAHLNDAVVSIFKQRNISITAEDARSSFIKEGLSFWVPAVENNIDFQEITDAYHCEINPSILHLEVCEETISAFRASKIQRAMYTHADPSWANETLKRQKLKEFFPDDDIWGLTRMCFMRKNKTIEGYHRIFEHYKVEPENAVMVEDSLTNLMYAKAAGANTVLITWGNQYTSVHPCVDYVFNSPLEMLKAVA